MGHHVGIRCLAKLLGIGKRGIQQAIRGGLLDRRSSTVLRGAAPRLRRKSAHCSAFLANLYLCLAESLPDQCPAKRGNTRVARNGEC